MSVECDQHLEKAFFPQEFENTQRERGGEERGEERERERERRGDTHTWIP